MDRFAFLFTSLLQVDGPSDLLVLNPATGESLVHHQLCCNTRYKTTWDTLYAKTLDVCAKALALGMPPAPNM